MLHSEEFADLVNICTQLASLLQGMQRIRELQGVRQTPPRTAKSIVHALQTLHSTVGTVLGKSEKLRYTRDMQHAQARSLHTQRPVPFPCICKLDWKGGRKPNSLQSEGCMLIGSGVSLRF